MKSLWKDCELLPQNNKERATKYKHLQSANQKKKKNVLRYKYSKEYGFHCINETLNPPPEAENFQTTSRHLVLSTQRTVKDADRSKWMRYNSKW